MLRGRDGAQLQDVGAVVLQGKPGDVQGLIGVIGGQVTLHSDHLHFLGATTRTVSTAEITGIAIPEAYMLNLRHGLQGVSFIELADRVALLASRGGVVSAIGPLLRPINLDVCRIPCPITDEANSFWTRVIMKPDPKLFEHMGKRRTTRPIVMRWGSANVLTLHETVGSGCCS